MKIIFDYKIFYQQKYGGISNYFYNLSKELSKLNEEIKFISPIHKNNYLNLIKKKNKKGIYIKFLPSLGIKLYESLNHIISNNIINSLKPDIIHETYYSKKNYKNNVKIVCTVYDMINEVFPNYSKKSSEITNMKLETVNRADRIFCISKKTKDDLIKFFNVDDKKIQVTYLSSSYEGFKYQKIKKKEFEDCLLFVGSRHGYKNFENFIKAYSNLKFLQNNFRIIFFGGEKPGKYEFDILKKNNVKKNKILFYTDNDYDLSYIYSNVLALVYPSLYEGFGIPILEAMSLGCPVVSSDGGALKEIGGEGINYFNPMNIDDISYKIEMTLNSSNSVNKIIDYGLNRSKQFSWKKCAEQTLKVYNSLQNE